jgi:hypothetical protein
MVKCNCPSFKFKSIETVYIYWKTREINPFDLFDLMRDIACIAAIIQLLLLVLVMFTGYPGVFVEGEGFKYISDNFCSKQAIGALFMIATFPTWILLTCSIAIERDYTRGLILALISLPLPMGLGIVFFSICETPGLHYVFVNAFVVSIGGVHFVVAATADHSDFMKSYLVLLVGSAMCGLLFIVLAFTAHEPGIQRNTAVILEYLAVTGFIVLNSLSTDRVREHVVKKCKKQEEQEKMSAVQEHIQTKS